jgi:CubicO group peptidase (beta-lactamase class C family)
VTDVPALRDLIEAERVRFEVPGCAVAVIVDGEVVLAEGFGVRDRGTGQPVTADTLFPIASDTKNFTAAAVCQLADEGLLDLDAPVRTYIPWFEMADAHATALVSARDLLGHRTGLPRHDLVWYGEGMKLTLEDVTRALRHLPLSRQLRQTWQYNNLCYSASGYLTEVVTGQDWSDVIRTRILEPLGMSATRFASEPWAEGDFATPYNLVKGELQPQVLPSSNKLLPPGGIVSNVRDLAAWALARLGRDEGRVLSDAALPQLHTPGMIGGTVSSQFPERQPLGYALGCQVESYRGTQIIRHGGNLVGYSSDVCVVPSLGAAVVTLTNMHGTPLRDAVALMVLDRVLGLTPAPWGERYHEILIAGREGKSAVEEHRAAKAQGRAPSRPLEEFAGSYEHPAYGTLTLDATGEALGVDFHGLGDRLRLTHRDRDVFELTLVEFESSLPVVFDTGKDAEVTGLRVQLEPMTDPILFAKARPPVTPGLLEQVAGTYTHGPVTVTVRVVEDQVTVSTPQLTLPLRALGGPAFDSPAMPAVRIEFLLSDDGQVTELLVDPMGRFAKVDS